MKRYHLSPARVLAVVAFVGSCCGLLLYMWIASGGETPLAAQGYRVHLLLPQAKGLGQHSDVRVSGVTVGHIVSIEPAQPVSLGRADVLIDLDKRYVPLRADARAMLRGKSILGEAYVALSLGTADAPGIEDGGTLAAARADRAVEPDEIFRTFDARTRAALREWLQTQSPGLAAHAYDLNAAFGSLYPWEVDADRLLATVQGQSADVQALLRDGGDIADGLADRGVAIRTLATSGDRAFNATGRQSRALADAFREMPGFETEARATLDAMTAFARAHTDDVVALKGELAPLSPALEALSADAPALRTITAATPDLSRAAQRGLPALDRVLGAAPRLLDDADPFLRSLNPALRYLAGGRTDLTLLIANLAAATETATSTPNSREPVHYLRAMPVLNPAVLGPLSRRPGVNRQNPYPGGALDLATGYPVLNGAACGNPTPYITPEPSQWLNDAQRDQVRLYAFADHIPDPPAPACRQQASGFPQLAPDPAALSAR